MTVPGLSVMGWSRVGATSASRRRASQGSCPVCDVRRKRRPDAGLQFASPAQASSSRRSHSLDGTLSDQLEKNLLGSLGFVGHAQNPPENCLQKTMRRLAGVRRKIPEIFAAQKAVTLCPNGIGFQPVGEQRRQLPSARFAGYPSTSAAQPGPGVQPSARKRGGREISQCVGGLRRWSIRQRSGASRVGGAGALRRVLRGRRPAQAGDRPAPPRGSSWSNVLR